MHRFIIYLLLKCGFLHLYMFQTPVLSNVYRISILKKYSYSESLNIVFAPEEK